MQWTLNASQFPQPHCLEGKASWGDLCQAHPRREIFQDILHTGRGAEKLYVLSNVVNFIFWVFCMTKLTHAVLWYFLFHPFVRGCSKISWWCFVCPSFWPTAKRPSTVKGEIILPNLAVNEDLQHTAQRAEEQMRPLHFVQSYLPSATEVTPEGNGARPHCPRKAVCRKVKVKRSSQKV